MKKILFPSIATVIVVLIIIFLFMIGKRKEQGDRKDVLSDIPVNVVGIKKQVLSNLVSMVGVINPNNDVDIIGEAQGIVKAIHVKVGDNVKKGMVLFEIDDLVLRSDMARSEINFFKSKRDFERNKTLYEQNSISAAQLDLSRLDMQSAENEMTRSQKALDDTKVKATISGTINSRKINEGSYVQLNSVLGNIVDISTLKVRVNVSEKDAFMLSPGDSVEITTDVYPGQIFYGHVDNIASKADDDHTFPVEIKLPNSSENPLKGGMFARVNFTSITSRNTLVIPREALIGSVKNAQVFIVSGNIARLRNITLGRESGQFLEVLNGLEEGMFVVTSGQNNCSDNVKVVIVK
ncbi:MAG: efflux RND transporter periplasmic adaptor subunit [Bacteroidales bacterium]|nr:efflux RND transporter periplasmic adaptor subunit [Bacteroidales bacterium]MDD4604356.1 efflux RND transporter periplasmic adaptor subunit [Bacteroidales bacterium]